MESHLTVSAQVILYVNGSKYANCSGFSWHSETPRVEKYGIDMMQPYELAQTVTRCGGRIGMYRAAGDGGPQGAGIVAPYPDLSREKYFTLALVAIRYGLVIFEANHCSCTAENWDAPARGRITGGLTFSALEWNNEIRRM